VTEDGSKSSVLINELIGMIDEFLQHMSLLEQENRDLRARLENAGTEGEAAAPEAAPEACTVLVVDADETQSKVLTQVLTKQGCEPTVVTSGADALSACENTEYGLIIVESKLGDGSGLDILKQLAEKSPDTDILIIVGFTSADTAVQALRLGAADFLLRPLTEDDVADKLTELFKQQQIKTRSRRYLNNLRDRYQKLLKVFYDAGKTQ
jgi:ActR/RegA family two-component response regulator